METKKYMVRFDIEFDAGDNKHIVNSGVLYSDHEVTEEELRNYKWREKGKIISLNFSSREVS